MISNHTEDEDRAGRVVYRDDPMENTGLFISQELTAVKDFLAPEQTMKKFLQGIIDIWGHEMCEKFNLTPREKHKVRPRLDKTK